MAEEKIPLNLLADFAPVSAETWKNKIIADLKGADFDKKLVWRTPEGFNVQPFYRREDLKGLKTTNSAPGQFPYVRGTRENNEWDIRQNICACQNARKANAKALEVLNKGINSIGFCLNKEKLNYHFIKVLLQDIRIDIIPVNFTICACKAPELANILVRYIGREYKGVDAKNFRGSINVDPIKAMLLKGKPLSREQIAIAGDFPKNDRYQYLRNILTREIQNGYKLWKTNYMAYDLMTGGSRFADRYSPADLEEFRDYVERKLNRVEKSLNRDRLRDVFLHIYGNPVAVLLER